MAAKTKEMEANTQAIESKTVRVGNLGVEIASMKNDLSDTEEQLLENKSFLANMDSTCTQKEKEWDEMTVMRSEEMLAISETIKILNDDDALELFKKTLPAPALIQLQESAKDMTKNALSALRSSSAK